jgi:hypothetical protein
MPEIALGCSSGIEFSKQELNVVSDEKGSEKSETRLKPIFGDRIEFLEFDALRHFSLVMLEKIEFIVK